MVPMSQSWKRLVVPFELDDTFDFFGMCEAGLGELFGEALGRFEGCLGRFGEFVQAFMRYMLDTKAFTPYSTNSLTPSSD